jgi:Fe-S-cluster-containing dehydrogenase component
MSEYGLLIDYHYCTGCHSCEVACQQEHSHPAGQTGITVSEYVMETPKGMSIDYLPFPTALCDLCAARTHRGELPSCVKHCQASCMSYGPIGKLSQEMGKKSRVVLFKPQ